MTIGHRAPKRDIPRSNIIYTPDWLADYIHRKMGSPAEGVVLDPACGAGALLVPFWRHGCYTVGVDLQDAPGRVGVDEYWRGSFFYDPPCVQPDYIVLNPPWNQSKENDDICQMAHCRNIVELYMDQLVERYPGVPLAMIAPVRFWVDPTLQASRRRKFDEKWPGVTAISAVPKDSFAGHLVHSVILFFWCPTVGQAVEHAGRVRLSHLI